MLKTNQENMTTENRRKKWHLKSFYRLKIHYDLNRSNSWNALYTKLIHNIFGAYQILITFIQSYTRHVKFKGRHYKIKIIMKKYKASNACTISQSTFILWHYYNTLRSISLKSRKNRWIRLKDQKICKG